MFMPGSQNEIEEKKKQKKISCDRVEGWAIECVPKHLREGRYTFFDGKRVRFSWKFLVIMAVVLYADVYLSVARFAFLLVS